MYPPLNVNWP